MRIKYIYILPIFLVGFLLFDFFGNDTGQQANAKRIVQRAIEFHGGDHFLRFMAEFSFRGIRYTVVRDRGSYRYLKQYDRDGKRIKEALSNEGFRRWIDGEVVPLDEIATRKAGDALNSVIYFALLPSGLNDAAVHPKWLGQSRINDHVYDKIEITFDEQGGGTDFEDRFVYWFDAQTGSMDYLAYHFHVNDGGTRFRSARNMRKISGIRFADYVNFKGPENRFDIENFDELFKTNQLEKLSEINLLDITVGPVSP